MNAMLMDVLKQAPTEQSPVSAETAGDREMDATATELNLLLTGWVNQEGVGGCIKLAVGALALASGAGDQNLIELAADIADSGDNSSQEPSEMRLPELGDLFAEALS